MTDCPHCGGALEFIKDGNLWQCPFCESVFFNEAKQRRKTFDGGLALLKNQERDAHDR